MELQVGLNLLEAFELLVESREGELEVVFLKKKRVRNLTGRANSTYQGKICAQLTLSSILFLLQHLLNVFAVLFEFLDLAVEDLGVLVDFDALGTIVLVWLAVGVEAVG